MTCALFRLRVRTFTINSDDISGTYTPPVNQTLSRHDVIWQRTVNTYSDNK